MQLSRGPKSQTLQCHIQTAMEGAILIMVGRFNGGWGWREVSWSAPSVAQTAEGVIRDCFAWERPPKREVF